MSKNVSNIDFNIYSTKDEVSSVDTKLENKADLLHKHSITDITDYKEPDLTQYATKNELSSEIANLVNSAPETLDTLKELSDALGNDPNFATTVANQIGTKADDDSVVHNSGAETISGVKTFSDTITGNISGNAVTATKLATTRTINGTSFDGTKNITTANWGTARNISISDDSGTNTGDAVSVNGSVNVTLKLPATIKATLSGNASTATTATKANQLTTARTIAIGGAVTGTATSFNGTANITIDTTRVNLEDAGMSGELPIAHGGTGRTDGKAVGLVTARTIDGVSFDGTANVSHFGTCSTAAATAAKVVSCSGFTLTTGARIIVQFTVTNSAVSPTLNVNNTGAKAITYRNAAISAGYLAANRVYEFVYDGTNYELIGDINTDTNTDTKVTQTVTTTNAEYALLTMADAAATATKTNGARFASAVTLNPSTKKITCAGLSGTTPKSTWVDAAKSGGSLVDYPDISDGAFASFVRYKTTNGAFVVGGYKSEFGFYYLTDTNIDAGTNTVAETVKINESGVLSSTGGFSGNLTGTASKATADSLGQNIADTYIKGLSVSGTTITITKGDGGTSTIKTQDTNTDTKVTQTVTTTNAEYPILASADAKKTATSTTTTRFDSGITLNPGTNTITAGTFKGALSGNATTATTATKANQLTTARTIWGQSFNGTGNISGRIDHASCLEFGDPESGNGGYIDFHFDRSTADYTSRIIETSKGTITVIGNINGSKVYNAVWNDYAEFFPETEPGDIIGLDLNSETERYIKARLDTPPVGVHSFEFAHLIGGETPPSGVDFYDYNIKKYIPVGLAGRVKVKVIGPVKKGDYITVSHLPGIGKVYYDDVDDFKKVIGIVCDVEKNANMNSNIILVKIKII